MMPGGQPTTRSTTIDDSVDFVVQNEEHLSCELDAGTKRQLLGSSGRKK